MAQQIIQRNYFTTLTLMALLESKEPSTPAIPLTLCYTVAERPFFRKKSNKIIELEANVRAGFRSDVKSYSVSNNRKCFNLHRLGYPGTDKDNLCTDLE